MDSDFNSFNQFLVSVLANAYSAVRRARRRIADYRKQYNLLRRTLLSRQHQLDAVLSFLRECNMLDYYENFIENHQMDRMASKRSENSPVIEEQRRIN